MSLGSFPSQSNLGTLAPSGSGPHHSFEPPCILHLVGGSTVNAVVCCSLWVVVLISPTGMVAVEGSKLSASSMVLGWGSCRSQDYSSPQSCPQPITGQYGVAKIHLLPSALLSLKDHSSLRTHCGIGWLYCRCIPLLHRETFYCFLSSILLPSLPYKYSS